MKKVTYLRKLEVVKTRVTNTTTVAEIKQQTKLKKELNSFWKKSATVWLEDNVLGEPYKDFSANWASAKFTFTLAPSGFIKATLLSHDQTFTQGFTTAVDSEYLIPKKALLK